MAEDYVEAASMLTTPPITLGRFGYSPADGRLPLERPNLLGVLQSPLRRPGVMERWAPLDIATFEGALSMFGKQFGEVTRSLQGRKTCKEVVEFYYVWKLTTHYDAWKASFEPLKPKLPGARADAMLTFAGDEDDHASEDEEISTAAAEEEQKAAAAAATFAAQAAVVGQGNKNGRSGGGGSKNGGASSRNGAGKGK